MSRLPRRHISAVCVCGCVADLLLSDTEVRAAVRYALQLCGGSRQDVTMVLVLVLVLDKARKGSTAETVINGGCRGGGV